MTNKKQSDENLNSKIKQSFGACSSYSVNYLRHVKAPSLLLVQIQPSRFPRLYLATHLRPLFDIHFGFNASIFGFAWPFVIDNGCELDLPIFDLKRAKIAVCCRKTLQNDTMYTAV